MCTQQTLIDLIVETTLIANSHISFRDRLNIIIISWPLLHSQRAHISIT